MGKTGKGITRLRTSWPRRAGGRTIFCPWLHGLDAEVHMWLGVLSWHDANAGLLAALAGAGRRPAPPDLFAAMFCADPFRSPNALFAALLDAGVAGIINLPSVTFIDGSFSESLATFNLGVDRELDCLRRARAAGLRVAGCANSPAMAETLCELGAELVVLHDGPPIPGPAKLGPAPNRGFRSTSRRLGIETMSLDDLLRSRSGDAKSRKGS